MLETLYGGGNTARHFARLAVKYVITDIKTVFEIVNNTSLEKMLACIYSAKIVDIQRSGYWPEWFSA